MVDLIQHTLGICGDTHSHFDLIDLLTFSSAESPYLTTIKNYWNIISFKIKNIFT